MQINVRVELGAEDSFAYTPDQAAAQVLAALGGDSTKDYCNTIVQMAPTSGSHGTLPPPGPPVDAGEPIPG